MFPHSYFPISVFPNQYFPAFDGPSPTPTPSKQVNSRRKGVSRTHVIPR